MEKIWEELKKIDSQAAQIQTEAQKNAKEIIKIAQKKAETLVEDSKNYAQQEAQQFFENAVEEANRKRSQQLAENQQTTKNLTRQVQLRMEPASATIVAAVIGEA
jgi:vacuolar-type H+-ATPase subunit H